MIVFFRNNSDNKKLTKSLTTIKTVESYQFNDNNNVVNPHLIVNTFENWENVNYVWIQEYRRYYFLTKPVTVRGGRLEFDLHTDVLTSRHDEILALSCLVNRNTNQQNSYIEDPEQMTLSYRTQKIINFPAANRFNQGLQYVLTVAGGGGSL